MSWEYSEYLFIVNKLFDIVEENICVIFCIGVEVIKLYLLILNALIMHAIFTNFYLTCFVSSFVGMLGQNLRADFELVLS